MPIIDVDFTGVETSAGFLPPGAYQAQIVAVEQRQGREYPGLKITWASVESATEGMRADQFISLAPRALWKLKGMLEDLGSEIPQSTLRLNTDRWIGKVATIKVINEPWIDSAGESHDSSKVDTTFRATGDRSTVAPAGEYKEVPNSPEPASSYAEDDDIPF